MLVLAQSLMEAGVSRFSADDLFEARHTCDLKPREEVFLNVDARQAGLGGASCGPGVLPKYLVRPGVFRFIFVLRPWDGNTDPAEWRRRCLPTLPSGRAEVSG